MVEIKSVTELMNMTPEERAQYERQLQRELGEA